MDVELNRQERNLILAALWHMRVAVAGPKNEKATGLEAGAGIDQVAEKLGGTPGSSSTDWGSLRPSSHRSQMPFEPCDEGKVVQPIDRRGLTRGL